MKESPASSRPANPAFTALVVTAVSLAAFLAFLVQPMMGKRLLPISGETYGLWIGCVVYFQIALALGYGWAAWLARKPVGFQTVAMLALALVALATFHLPSDQIEASAGLMRVIWHLSLASLPAMILLFSISPILRDWLARRGQEIPGYLYAVSNGASLLALLIYPFLVETYFGLQEQRFYWHGCLTIVIGLTAAVIFVMRRPGAVQASAREANVPEFFTTRIRLAWFALSALGCISILGATYQLASEMGSIPLAWIVPLGIYLLGFMAAFSGRWRAWMTQTTIVWLALSLTGYMVTKGFTPATVNGGTALWLVSLTVSAALLTNALLHRLRPQRQFERFYLVLAAGSAVGGFVYGIVIPVLLSQPVEFVLASAGLLTIAMLWISGRRDPQVILITAAVIFIPVLGLGLKQRKLDALNGGLVYHLRDLSGHVMIKTDDHSVVLSNDTTTRATQLTADLPSRRRPTLYYGESSGVGRVIQRLQAGHPDMRVGVIGIGGGTLAAYARSADTYDFWDVDPKMNQVARRYFTYVAEAAGHINLMQRDGRRVLEANRDDYDLIVVDTFVGDSVPAHLLTREALAVYFKHLERRNGLLIVHASSRYYRLFPVVEATARTLYHASIDVVTEVSATTPTSDWDPTRTEYIIVGQPGQIHDVATWFAAEEDKGRVKHAVSAMEAPLFNPQLIWTDDRNAAIDAIELGRFLFE